MLDRRIEERARMLVAEHLCVDPMKIGPEAQFARDLGADSLDSVELALAIEEAFGVEVTDEESVRIFSSGKFADLTAFLAERRVAA